MIGAVTYALKNNSSFWFRQCAHCVISNILIQDNNFSILVAMLPQIQGLSEPIPFQPPLPNKAAIP